MTTSHNPTLKQRIAEHDRLLAETGHMFGLKTLPRKEGDPGNYEALWQILLNVCGMAWTVGCKVSSSPVAVEGGDALWSIHLPTGEAVATSRGIVSHPGLLSMLIRRYIESDYEVNPGFRPGDIFENNDPHFGGIHSPDFQTIIPIHHEGQLIAWAASVTHVMDGGFVLPGAIGFMNPNTITVSRRNSNAFLNGTSRYFKIDYNTKSNKTLFHLHSPFSIVLPKEAA